MSTDFKQLPAKTGQKEINVWQGGSAMTVFTAAAQKWVGYPGRLGLKLLGLLEVAHPASLWPDALAAACVPKWRQFLPWYFPCDVATARRELAALHELELVSITAYGTSSISTKGRVVLLRFLGAAGFQQLRDGMSLEEAHPND